MVNFEDLIEIENKDEIRECLEGLIAHKDEDGNSSPIITGYNWYNKLPKADRIATFSNIHESDAYKQEMLVDLEKLGYSRDQILEYLREKGSFFIWELDFKFCDQDGKPYKKLRVWDIKQKQWLDLKLYKQPLIKYDGYKEREGNFVAEDLGWQLDMPFHSREELLSLIGLFIQKGSEFLFDLKGNKFEGLTSNQSLYWSGSYETPVLLLGQEAMRYADELIDFTQATKVAFYRGSNEISFIVHRRLEELRESSNYNFLIKQGFQEELCFGNKIFIKEYVDKERKR